jgi:hypothetical protein
MQVEATAQERTETYLGFDRNTYPGDANLKALHQTFSYSGYWLNNPPGERMNTWTGHRAAVESAGFGFLVLFNGRLSAELKSVAKAAKLGNSDAQAAAAAGRREGFPARIVIFLDQEQGGRMLPEQKAYIYAWVDAVTATGFRAGVYCSGIPAKDDDNVVTADDIRRSAAGRQIVYWAINDACPRARLQLSCESARSPAKPGPKWCPLRRGLAVRAIAAPQRCGRTLLQLQPRRQLLSARNSRRATTPLGRGQRNLS